MSGPALEGRLRDGRHESWPSPTRPRASWSASSFADRLRECGWRETRATGSGQPSVQRGPPPFRKISTSTYYRRPRSGRAGDFNQVRPAGCRPRRLHRSLVRLRASGESHRQAPGLEAARGLDQQCHGPTDGSGAALLSLRTCRACPPCLRTNRPPEVPLEEPDPPDDIAAFSPAGASAHHLLSLAWPFISLAFASPMWRYSGRPARVICFMPSERSTEPTRFRFTPIAWTESSARPASRSSRSHRCTWTWTGTPGPSRSGRGSSLCRR